MLAVTVPSSSMTFLLEGEACQPGTLNREAASLTTPVTATTVPRFEAARNVLRILVAPISWPSGRADDRKRSRMRHLADHMRVTSPRSGCGLAPDRCQDGVEAGRETRS